MTQTLKLMKRYISCWTLLCVLIQVWAQAPDGYYAAANGKRGSGLKTALFQIITDHTQRTYADLWTDMQTTDAREDGKVWDMYSGTTNFAFVSDQCGNYSGEGSCYNREHSFPKSWFNDAYPMYTDLFHLYPTDGYVNSRRSNYPFGETNNPTYTSSGGFSKLGPSSISGYSGTVFEPADEYKGDFARTYFYMATCYEDRIAGWDSDMLAGNSYPAYRKWAVDMLLRWAAEDPVSEKEIRRNNAVYGIQHNRNPYIDFPGLEQYVWGDKTDVAFDADNYNPGTNPPAGEEVAAPVFTPSSGGVMQGTVVTVSTATEDALIVYSVNSGNQYTEAPPVRISIEEPTTVEAYAMLGTQTSERVSATYTIVDTTPDEGMQTFTKVTSASELQTGRRYLIVCESKNTVMGAANGDVRSYCEVSPSGNTLQTEVDREGLPYQVTLGGSEGAYTLFDAATQTYLALTSNANKLHSLTDTGTEETEWNITVSNGTADICNKKYPRYIRYNSGAPRFACYASGQQAVSLWMNTKTGTGISAATADDANEPVDVYDTGGRLVRSHVPAKDALQGLPKGIYIIKGNKTLVR